MNFLPIYDEFYHPVKIFIAAMVKDEWTADDLVQETFLKVQKKIQTLKDPSKIKPWIFSIARNVSRDHFRKSIPIPIDENQGEHGDENFQAPLVQIELEQHQMSQCVEDKVNLLPASHKEIIVLSDTMELSHQEIAEILGITVSNVKVRLHRARKAMKEILERDCSFEHDERNVMVCLPKEGNNNLE
jgi:RNA polymerase sigma-70 factor (ECF subfamily)